MSTSRAESQHPQYGRRRSNTAQSILRNPPISPLRFGDSKVLNVWVHDPKESVDVMFNQSWWPGVAEDDMMRVTCNNPGSDKPSYFFFMVLKDEGRGKPQLQLSIPKPISETFGIRNNCDVTVTKVDKEEWSADYIELAFQDQYLGRNDMWRLGKYLVGKCVYADQDIAFIGSISATIRNIYIGGRKSPAAHVMPSTKVIYRSLSAKVTIFIQVCRELWEFAGDGERYNEKIVHSFLPTLFAKWRDAGTNHTVTIVLISRVYYDQSEIDYAAGPLRQDEDGNWYKDFFKVITDLEVIYEWKPTLVSLKDSFWAFQRDILLTHHHHRTSLDSSSAGTEEQVRLVGKLSFAHDGPILEALNMGLNPNETHYIDRSLSLTGASTILITPGTGYFRVSKQLLRLTTTRMLDQGFGLDLVSLAKPPLHQSPILSFQGVEPELRVDRDGHPGARVADPLWGGDDDSGESASREKTTFWWEPFWMTISFWDKQMDLPFREDRFIARAKMHELQMLGLLEHDVLMSIEVPFLPDHVDPYSTPPNDSFVEDDVPTQDEADKFDLDLFALKTEAKPSNAHRHSVGSSAGTASVSSSYWTSMEKRTLLSQRSSVISAKITPIEESPRRIIKDLPGEEPSRSDGPFPIPTSGLLSTSPSQSSMRSVRSAKSTASSSTDRRSGDTTSSRPSVASKFAPSWLFKPFRSVPSQPQTSPVSAYDSSKPAAPAVNQTTPVRMSSVSTAPITMQNAGVSPKSGPMTIINKNMPGGRAASNRALEDEFLSHKTSFSRRSPLSTPPRDEPTFGKRRGTMLLSSSFTRPNPNPSQPRSAVSYAQSTLACRWQHMYPQLLYKHEIKWKSMVTPGCLPLTVEQFPSTSELESSYDVFSYDFVVDPREMRSFLVKPPVMTGRSDDDRRAWALAVMRGMAAVRLAQGFQFVLRSQKAGNENKPSCRPTKSFMVDEDMTPKPSGAAEVLLSTNEPIYLSMSNEIHRISYTGEAIQVRRYVRRMPPTEPYAYECLIWPKLGGGYTELATSFTSHGLENYGWNRLDMLVAGYEHQFNESLRYWRTRFVVIPTAELPLSTVGPLGEKLNDEETRLLGMDKLAEMFSKMRWQPQDDKQATFPPVRFIPTTLGPALSIMDESIVGQLDEIHAAGPLRKKMKSEREIGEMSVPAIAKAMREEDGVRIRHYQWHLSHYLNAFTGFDFVSWLVREFRDVSSRAQGAEWGAKLLEQGLFEHCRGQHGFLDGHYFYRLKGEYAVASTPRGWFRSVRPVEETPRLSFGGTNKPNSSTPRKNRKRLILSQTMVIDIDPNKRSDQAEYAILHHDIIHNPNTVFHFELQWIGTTARCIDDLLRQWSRAIERYGLKLVEAYVTQISDVRERNPFQSCFPLRLAAAPPVVANLDKRIPEGTQAAHYFEYALLRRFGFILDIEAADMYPDRVDVVYSYRRSTTRYSQFVHRSGVAFVQVLDGMRGFLYLTNRLMWPGRMGSGLKSKDHRYAATAEDIRNQLHQFCSDGKQLAKFYEEEVALLGSMPEEPPPLVI